MIIYRKRSKERIAVDFPTWKMIYIFFSFLPSFYTTGESDLVKTFHIYINNKKYELFTTHLQILFLHQSTTKKRALYRMGLYKIK